MFIMQRDIAMSRSPSSLGTAMSPSSDTFHNVRINLDGIKIYVIPSSMYMSFVMPVALSRHVTSHVMSNVMSGNDIPSSMYMSFVTPVIRHVMSQVMSHVMSGHGAPQAVAERAESLNHQF